MADALTVELTAALGPHQARKALAVIRRFVSDGVFDRRSVMARRVQVAAAMLAGKYPRNEIAESLRQRFGVSRATAYRTISAAHASRGAIPD